MYVYRGGTHYRGTDKDRDRCAIPEFKGPYNAKQYVDRNYFLHERLPSKIALTYCKSKQSSIKELIHYSLSYTTEEHPESSGFSWASDGLRSEYAFLDLRNNDFQRPLTNNKP